MFQPDRNDVSVHLDDLRSGIRGIYITFVKKSGFEFCLKIASSSVSRIDHKKGKKNVHSETGIFIFLLFIYFHHQSILPAAMNAGVGCERMTEENASCKKKLINGHAQRAEENPWKFYREF